MKRSKENLNTLTRVLITDYTEYDANLCHTGGGYSYGTSYTRRENGWKIEYETSAQFGYCRYCGTFTDDEKHCSEPEVITTEELDQILDAFYADPEKVNSELHTVQYFTEETYPIKFAWYVVLYDEDQAIRCNNKMEAIQKGREIVSTGRSAIIAYYSGYQMRLHMFNHFKLRALSPFKTEILKKHCNNAIQLS